MRKGRIFNARRQPERQGTIEPGAVLRKCISCGRNNLEITMLDAPGGGKSCRKCYPKLISEAGKSGHYRLPDDHLEKAKLILGLSHPNKNCRHCFGRGWTAVNSRNEAISCKCVDADLAMYRWKSYVREHPDLHEAYRWALEGESVQKSMEDIEKGGE